MHKLFKKFKNWDLTTMGYYSFIDFQNLEMVKKQFNRYTERSMYSKQNDLKPSHIFKYWKKDTDFRNFRIDTFLSNLNKENGKKDQPALYVTQSETRNMKTQDVLLFLNWPLKHIRDEVINTMHGEFDYDILDEFMKRWDIEDNTTESYNKLSKEFNERYPKIINEQYVWGMNSELDLHASFRKYGQLNIPVIDRPFSIWMGSSHTFFHACYLKWDYLKVMIKVPVVKKGGYDKHCSSWYSVMSPNNFGKKCFYVYHFDLENEKIHYKKFDTKYHEEMRMINTIPQDLYKEFKELKL